MKKEILYLLIMLASAVGSGQYGNYKYTNYGTKSILLTGNVTGSVEDLGLTYYNPARLALVTSNGISINAQAYEYRTTTLKDADGQTSSLKDSDFNSLPSMAAGTFSLFGTRFAYSYLRTNSRATSLNYRSQVLEGDIVAVQPGEERYNYFLDFNSRSRSQLYGLAWATRITERLSVGISLFGAYFSARIGNYLEYAIQAETGGVVFSQNRHIVRQSSYGLLTKIGFSYELPGVELGMNVNLPYLEIFGNGSFTYNDILAGLSPEQDQIYYYSFGGLTSNQKSPFGISVGAGVPIGKHKLHLNVDYVASLAPYERIIFPSIDLGDEEPAEVSWEERRNAVINFGVGAEIFLSDKVIIYSGISTDFNALSSDSNFFIIDDNIGFRSNSSDNFYHMGLGTGLNFSWADLTLGVAYTQSTSDTIYPFQIRNEIIDDSGNAQTSVVTRRWQFIVGLDIPFLDNTVKGLIK